YHGGSSTVTLKHLGRSYAALTEDTTRVKGRIKALYRSQAIASAGKKPLGRRHRGEWLAQLTQAGMRRRAERLYEELDALLLLRREARRELIVESHKHDAVKLLRTVPFLGPIRAAVLIGRVETPHRFRTKRQFWAYCGLALETRSSAEYRFQEGQLVRAKKPVFIRGLNHNHNHDLKNLFKSAATTASAMPGPFRTFYENLLVKGMQPAMARLTLARKIAAITLCVWKKGEPFDAEYVKPQAA
ncbi:MAG TPA: IS110 family transposase, partial [Candidatus Acidoferrales bacterium]|nr:IS110 family transposase [Candidatus Acidoferrales bacterium]